MLIDCWYKCSSPNMLIQNVDWFIDTNVHHWMLIQNVDWFIDTNVHHWMLIQNVDWYVDTNVHHIMLIQNFGWFVDTNVHHMLIQNVDWYVDTNVHHIMWIQNVDWLLIQVWSVWIETLCSKSYTINVKNEMQPSQTQCKETYRSWQSSQHQFTG